jgi:AraC-like DNA-binding protein
MNTNYFNYLPENRTCASWGCTVRGLGRAKTIPGAPYPPRGHPDDHQFTPDMGRIIDAFQILMISEGSGIFKSSRTRGTQTVEAGSLFILFPSVWHCYAPAPETGWTEHWIECRGHAFETALKKRAIKPNQPIRPADSDFVHLFAEIHAWAARGALAHQTVISAQGLQLLALLADSKRNGGDEGGEIVQRAMMRIMENLEKRINMRQLAEEMNIGYTRFSKLFQEHAHTSPKQYHLQVRLERGRELLLNTSMTVKEIASRLGFENPFHFTNQFREVLGVPPRAWRTREQHRSRA